MSTLAAKPVQPAPSSGPTRPATTGLWRSVPNLLTGLRVAMAVVFFVVLSVWRFDPLRAGGAVGGPVDALLLAGAGLFIVASLTDLLDGYFARRWGVESTFGRIMDPFADKVLVVGALVFLAGPDFWWPTPGPGGAGLQISGVYPWMVVVVLARELLVTSIRGVLESQGVRFGAEWSGKIKMIVQSAAVPLILLLLALTPVLPEPPRAPWGRTAVDVTAWIMVGVTILSGAPYVVRAARLLAQERARVKRGGGAEPGPPA